eukprot:gene2214-2417_t
MDGQELQLKLQKAVDAMMEKVEREKIRPQQRNAHLRIANCFANSRASSQEVEGCANNCFVPLQHIQSVVQREMNQFQDRLSRCSMDCQDQAKDKFAHSQDEAGAQKFMYNCMSSCVDKHLTLLKSVQSNVERDIDNIVKQIN